MPHYREKFKGKLVMEMMSAGGRSASEIHRAIGMSENTLYSWKGKYGRGDKENETGRQRKPESWRGEKKGLIKGLKCEVCSLTGRITPELVRKAFKNVKRNWARLGLIRVSIQMFEANLDENLESLMRDLKTRGRFMPNRMRLRCRSTNENGRSLK